jgi:CTP:molybdopterin cytidylyltransferase MocA
MIAGLLLASGASRRFGSNKLVAPLNGRPVVRWSAEALASAVDETWVVVPSQSAEVRAALEGVPVHWWRIHWRTKGWRARSAPGSPRSPPRWKQW